jgi:hypothetical protein
MATGLTTQDCNCSHAATRSNLKDDRRVLRYDWTPTTLATHEKREGKQNANRKRHCDFSRPIPDTGEFKYHSFATSKLGTLRALLLVS